MGHYDSCRGYLSCGHHESVLCSCHLKHLGRAEAEAARVLEHKRREAAMARPDVQRFMRHVDKLPCGCWFWTGARSRGRGNRKWYGSFRADKRRVVRAHRFACEVIGGRDCPPEHHRDHTCMFSMCVNPDHIEVVTHEENQRRKMERRR